MKKMRLMIVVSVLTLLATLVVSYSERASAHEHREVGEYEIVFGWQTEPAFAGVYNGPELMIQTHEDQKPVEGLEKSLKLKVSFGNQSKELKLEAAWNDPGHYVAYLTPTRPGDYSFELTGKIEDVVVKEKFTSADGDFSSVEPAGDILFPDAKMDGAGLQGQVDALKTQLEALKKEIEALKATKK